MYEFTVWLRAITPLFIYGASTKRPELRAASIRGAMRFWFRALAGTATNSSRLLYAVESKLFGDTNAKSNLVVEVLHAPVSTGEKRILPHKYMTLPAFVEGSRFSVRLVINTRSMPLAMAAFHSFWFSVTLGGWGRRWRRGAGSLEVTGIEARPKSFQSEIRRFMNLPLDKQLDTACSRLKIFLATGNTESETAKDWNSRLWPVIAKVLDSTKEYKEAWDDDSPMRDVFVRSSGVLVNLQEELSGQVKQRFASPIVMRTVKRGENSYSLRFVLLRFGDEKRWKVMEHHLCEIAANIHRKRLESSRHSSWAQLGLIEIWEVCREQQS